MGLFGNKEKRLEKKQAKSENKKRKSDLLDYYSKNNDLAINGFYFNDGESKFLIKEGPTKRFVFLHDYTDVVSITPSFQGGQIKKHHGITRAVVGGALAGPIGALVGVGTGGKEYNSITQLGITIYFKDNTLHPHTILNTETKIDSLSGKAAFAEYNHLISKFEQILANNSAEKTVINSTADEIRKYKELFDEGIITRAEFDKKKAELL